eukprot:3136701-Pyramimonas_sp.AAC.1
MKTSGEKKVKNKLQEEASEKRELSVGTDLELHPSGRRRASARCLWVKVRRLRGKSGPDVRKRAWALLEGLSVNKTYAVTSHRCVLIAHQSLHRLRMSSSNLYHPVELDDADDNNEYSYAIQSPSVQKPGTSSCVSVSPCPDPIRPTPSAFPLPHQLPVRIWSL